MRQRFCAFNLYRDILRVSWDRERPSSWLPKVTRIWAVYHETLTYVFLTKSGGILSPGCRSKRCAMRLRHSTTPRNQLMPLPVRTDDLSRCISYRCRIMNRPYLCQVTAYMRSRVDALLLGATASDSVKVRMTPTMKPVPLLSNPNHGHGRIECTWISSTVES